MDCKSYLTTTRIKKLNKLKYVSAPCGAGKTHYICNEINNSNDKFLIVQCTQELIRDTAKKINDCKPITTDSISNGKRVIDHVIDFMNSPSNRTLIISDKTFFKIPIELLSGWVIYLDDVTNFHEFKLINEGNAKIKEVIKDELICNIKNLDGSEEYIIADSKLKSHGDIVSNISNDFSIMKNNHILIMNKSYFLDSEKTQLSITGFKDLNRYVELDITFFSANFENSLIYKKNKKILKKENIQSLLTRKIPLKDRIKVYYFSEKIQLSKTWKKNNPEKLKKIYNYLNDKLKYEEFYWTKNRADIQKLNDGTKISPDPRGLNQYSKIKTCVWLACMRPSDVEASQCKLFFELSMAEIHHAREYESLHQFVLRGISRDYNSTEIQTVYVFDKFQANYLTDNIEYIDLGLDDDECALRGRPKGSTNKEKRFTLSNTKASRFSRWKANNPELNVSEFNKFLSSQINKDLNEEERNEMYNKYEKAIQKKNK
ncbi:type III restriction endonuclease subunit R [Providencia huaxiensis]|nr:type III restriction endonuclease subunit R [Providencia huaxiensis]MBQ0587807.1 type III restriction endonuclease subunit R [Providencia huaxiensis]